MIGLICIADDAHKIKYKWYLQRDAL
jgi:hypothetical protein